MASITSISPAAFDDGKPVTLTGSGFGASQGSVLIGGVAQNVNAWSDTSISFGAVRGLQPLGACRVDVVSSPSAPVTMQSSVTQYGITWTFDTTYPVGQFCNGDYFVVGPVTITGITRPLGVSTQDGSMINPTSGASVSQGFDSRLQDSSYSAGLNIANSLPYTVAVNTSVVSALSEAALTNSFYYLDTVAVLTVLSVAPPTGAFRPPYVGADKTIRFTESALSYGFLPNLTSVTGAPTLATSSAAFEKPWIEIKTNWQGRYWHPTVNQPGYGADMSEAVQSALLRLCIFASNAEKRDLLVRLVQYGLDVYGAALTGTTWNADGGHNLGRKGPLLLAGLALSNANILAYADKAMHFIFQEDQQTFYVAQADVDRGVGYVTGDIGTPEWGRTHSSNPGAWDTPSWTALYRGINGSALVGTALFVNMVGARANWNWAPFFDYHDRFMAYELGPSGPVDASNPTPTFVKNMWTTYRTSYPPVWS
jgi:hypothetical protein